MPYTLKIDQNFGLCAQSLAILHLLVPQEFSCRKYFNMQTAPFYNGRERGVIVYLSDGKETLHVWWAENRNSDDIVVYKWVLPGTGYLNPPTLEHMPEIAWSTRHFFSYKQTSEAAIYIQKEIDNFIVTHDKES